MEIGYWFGKQWVGFLSLLMEGWFRSNPFKTTITKANWESIKVMIIAFAGDIVREGENHISVSNYDIKFGITRIEFCMSGHEQEIKIENAHDTGRTLYKKKD